MPRQLKRGSGAISRDRNDSESEDEPQTQTQRRQRRRSTPSEDSDAGSQTSSRASPAATSQTTETILVKKIVRLALATEYGRIPLRRSDITTKIFKDANAAGGRISFNKVFGNAQKVLRDAFGMQLTELPSKEKTTLKDRRTQATQTKSTSSSTSSKSWILSSILPQQLQTNPVLSQPTHAPDTETESSYTALYTFILSLIYMNNSSLTDGKLERYLKRVNADTYTPLGNKEKVLQRMMKEGYIERRRDTSSGEEIIEWVPGPRGKIEVGVEGVVGLVRTVYGYGVVELSRGNGQNNHRRRRNEDEDEDSNAEEVGRLVKIEEEELNAKLSRSLGIRLGEDGAVQDKGRGEDAEEEEAEPERDDPQPGPSRRGGQRGRPSTAGRSQGRSGGRRNARNDDDDDSD